MIDFNEIIDEEVTRLDAERRENHVSSGKLSAGMLAYPIQWSVLKLIGVPGTTPDPYTLRKFARGNQVEDWFVDTVIERVGGEAQKFVEYRGCVGYVDLVTADGIPQEVKSVTNMKFKRITQSAWPEGSPKHRPADGPQYGHSLQAGLYALALESEQAQLHYIASDDLRLASYAIETEEVKDDIDQTIDAVDDAIAKGYVPVFAPRESWHSMTEYAQYIDFMQLNPTEIIDKLKRDYPEAYIKLTTLGGENVPSQ